MATIVEMPKLTDTMETGTLVAWKKNEGDPIEPGDVLAEVESDKATMELEAYDGGILRKHLAKLGDAIEVGGPLAIISEDADESIDELVQQAKKGGGGAAKSEEKAAEEKKEPTKKKDETKDKEQKKEGKEEEKGEEEKEEGERPRGAKPPAEAEAKQAPAAPQASGGQAQPATPQHGMGGERRVTASPLAARMAQELGLDLALIKGSGPGGRIVKRDIEQAKAEGMAATAPIEMVPSAAKGQIVHREDVEYEDIPNSSMRKTIATRLADSKTQIPHYYVTIEIDMGQTMALRAQLNRLDDVKISVNDFVIRAAAMALEKHPIMNASFQGGHIRVYHRIDIGMAVAMEDGLITPIIRGANKKGLRRISAESRDLAQRARAKRLRTDEYLGSTFTVSNLGMLGVQHFTAVINPPEAGILAVGAVREAPVAKDGQLSVGLRMDVTLSSDHRVVDGAQSARFLQDFKYFLENPIAFAL